MTVEAFDAFVQAHQWTFAKSMPWCPHHYVVRKQCRDDAEFCAAVAYIRANGHQRWWGRKKDPLLYVQHGAHFYWTMGNPIEETTIINRALVEGTQTRLHP